MSGFLDNARQIFETAENAMLAGEAPSELAILVGGEGGIRIIAGSDWPLESLQREHGASMAYQVSANSKGVRVVGREGVRTCQFETPAPAQTARLLLNAVPHCYAFAQAAVRSLPAAA